MQQFKIVGRVIALLLLCLHTIRVTAQEKSTEINVDINGGGEPAWYTSPWVWIIGAVVFILLLLALLRGTERRG